MIAQMTIATVTKMFAAKRALARFWRSRHMTTAKLLVTALVRLAGREIQGGNASRDHELAPHGHGQRT